MAIIRGKLGKEKLMKIVVAVGAAGILLILMSDFLPAKNTAQSSEKHIDINKYKKDTENELVELLEKIDGVGRVEVMVTVSCTEEYVYAEEIKKNTSGEKGTGSSQLQNSYVFIEKNGEKEALVSRINNPQISGVVIVCEGGGNAKVCEVVYRTVSTALGIPTGKIYVTKIS